MSDKVVRTYHHVSNRAKGRDPAGQKVVYKSVLDNPFQVEWPRVPLNVQNAILAHIVDMMDGVANFHRTRRTSRRSTKKHRRDQAGDNPRNTDDAIFDDTTPVDVGPTIADTVQLAVSKPVPDGMDSDSDITLGFPPIYQFLTIGINSVTKKLETICTQHRTVLHASDHTSMESISKIPAQLILVCRGDIDPPILISHIPSLVASCNSSHGRSPSNVSWLVPLSRGAETTLSQALGLKRVSVVAIDITFPPISTLKELLESVPVIAASWLTPAPASVTKSLVQTHIKQIRTTAPKSMVSAKEKRVRGRREAKERRKATPRARECARKQRLGTSGTST